MSSHATDLAVCEIFFLHTRRKTEVKPLSYLSSGVDMPAGVTDGDGADYLAMAQCAQLSGVARNARTNQRVGRERNRLQWAVRRHVERIRTVPTTPTTFIR